MADLKISELNSATTIATSDYFVVVQGGVTKKTTAENLLLNFPVSPVCREIPETISSGVVSISKMVSVISSSSETNINFTLPAGTNGMNKEIVVSLLQPLSTATISVVDGSGFVSVTFNEVGQTLSLKNISGKWYIMSIKGASIA